MTYIFTGPNKSPIFFNYLFIYITCQIFHVCAKQLVLLLTCFDLLSFCWCRYSGTWLSAPVDTATKASWCLSICAVEPKHVQGHYVCELKVFRQHLNRRVKVWRRHREWYADCCTNRVTVSVMLCDCLSDCCVAASVTVVWLPQLQCREILRYDSSVVAIFCFCCLGPDSFLQDDSAHPHRAQFIRE